jgi:2-dehydro-3-deoxyphosphogluconate aldolase / (4S)-4-hydroxy-2-oxoglutarate aldolase
MSAPAVLDLLAAERVLAIVRTGDAEIALAAVDGLVAAGVKLAELSLSRPGADEILRRVADRHGEALTLGAGTVRTPRQAREAVAAGARFLVAPGFDRAVLDAAGEQGVLHLPGVMTPTEVDQALAAGAPALKLFPAGAVGPSYVADLLGPFPDARLVATGGVDERNAAAFLGEGCLAVAFAGSLVPSEGPVTADAVAARARTLLSSLLIPTNKEPNAD